MRGIDRPFPKSFGILLPQILWIVLVMAGLLPVSGWSGEFETANQHYDQGEFKEAKQGYEKLVESGGGSANVFYDLGNTEFRLDSSGRAILNYERALALNPHHPEARANLSLLRERTGAKLLPAWWGRIVAVNLSPKAWYVAAAVSGWVALFGLVFLCTSRRASNFVAGVVTLIGVVAGALVAVALWSIALDQSLGIITAPETQARLAPAESAGVAADLPAGSQVRVLSERGDWIYCEMPNASRGWIASAAMEKVPAVEIMIRWLVVFCCLLAASGRAEDWSDAVPPPQPGKFPLPRPFKAVYHFGWSGLQAAQADFDFSKVPHNQFQLGMKTQTTGVVRTLWRLDANHTAVCAAATLRPIHLRQTEVYKGKTETTNTDFSDENVRWTTIKTPSKEPPMREHRFKLPHVLDLQTGWLYARSQRLQPGDHFRFVDFPATGGYLVDIEVLGREKLKVPAGMYDAIKCQVRVQCVTKSLELEPQKKLKRAVAWVSDDPQRLLLKIEADVFIGSVWCELQSAEIAQ